jgi:hypothetical protein
MKKAILAIIIVAVIVAVVVFVFVLGGSDDEDGGENIIPIQVNNADGVGALHIELVYDSSIIEVTDVSLGSLGENGQVDYEVESPGRVTIGFIDAMGMSGTGDVVEISFTENSDGKSSLVLENVVATDAETLYGLVVQTSAGSLDTNNDTSTAPVINIGP